MVCEFWEKIVLFPSQVSIQENATKEVRHLLYFHSVPQKSNSSQAGLETTECTDSPFKTTDMLTLEFKCSLSL